jgi:hypothetical protein
MELTTVAAAPSIRCDRYEAPYRFEVPFNVTITQNGHQIFSRVFGRRETPKVWGFASGRASGEYDCGPGLNSECAWPWGATENMVWEIGAPVVLAAGPAVISVTPVRDTSCVRPLLFANNNDVIVNNTHCCAPILLATATINTNTIAHDLLRCGERIILRHVLSVCFPRCSHSDIHLYANYNICAKGTAAGATSTSTRSCCTPTQLTWQHVSTI